MRSSARVLHVVNGEFYAGAERVQDLLALQLPGMGYEVGFVCLKDGLFPCARKAKDAPLHSFPMRARLDLGPALRIASLARRGGYGLIHTHTSRSALLGRLAAGMAGVPMVHHVHSPTARDTEEGWRNARNAAMERLSLSGAARMVCVSASLERYLLERGVSAHRIRTVWNGVPIQDVGRRPWRAGEPMVLGTVALFRPRKGLEVLLRAMARLRRAGYEVRLRAVGPFETEEYRESVLRLAAELRLEGHVHWTGFTEDVAAELRRVHAFVLPSLFGEGMPMVVLEAMALGLPVVSTRVEGIPSVVREGRDGLLVEPGSHEALAWALRLLLSGEVDAAALGDSGRRRQQEAFSDLAMARGVAEIYREVLDTRLH